MLMSKVNRMSTFIYLIFLDESHERRSFDLDRLIVSIVKGYYEMKEITLSQVARWLFLEMRLCDADPVTRR